MKMLVSAAAVLLLGAASFAADGDWPKWCGPKGNCTTGEKGLLEQWPEGGPKELWRKPVGLGHPAA